MVGDDEHMMRLASKLAEMFNNMDDLLAYVELTREEIIYELLLIGMIDPEIETEL